MVAFPLYAQSQNSPSARLDRLEREIQTLSRSVFKGDVPPPQYNAPTAPDNSAAMEVRFNQLESQLQNLTGQIEEQGYQLRQLEEKINGLSSSATQSDDNSTGRTSQTYSSDINGNSDAATSVVPQSNENQYQLGTLSEQEANTPAALYDKAFAYLQSNDYSAAQTTFEDFLATYPDHSLAANAQYWLGETYYAREDYTQSARIFAQSYQKYPDGQKAPDTLLKLAMSLGNQGMENEACLTLSELEKQFPNGPSAVISKAEEESRTYNCGS